MFTIIHGLLCDEILNHILISEHFTEADTMYKDTFVTCVWFMNTVNVYCAESRCKYLYQIETCHLDQFHKALFASR